MDTVEPPKPLDWGQIIITLICSFLLICVCLGLISTPCSRPRESANRAACAANLKGVVGSTNTYAADNEDWYPCLKPSETYTNSPYGHLSSQSTSSEEAATQLINEPSNQINRASQVLWFMALHGKLNPKLFICKSDHHIQSVAPSTDAQGRYLLSFSPGSLSYSITYPWTPAGKPGAWWKNTLLSDLPIASDMAPAQSDTVAVGSQPGAPEGSAGKVFNSSNHGGDGQNVAYADGHVEFQRTPYAGHTWDVQGQNPKPDNIWTTQPGNRPLNPRQFVAPSADKSPFDTLMVPARNSRDGSF